MFETLENQYVVPKGLYLPFFPSILGNGGLKAKTSNVIYSIPGVYVRWRESRIIESENEGATETMLEQQKQTQLEGIRQKVFMDRYSLKDASGQPLEFYPEHLWARVARGIAAVEPEEEVDIR